MINTCVNINGFIPYCLNIFKLFKPKIITLHCRFIAYVEVKYMTTIAQGREK